MTTKLPKDESMISVTHNMHNNNGGGEKEEVVAGVKTHPTTTLRTPHQQSCVCETLVDLSL